MEELKSKTEAIVDDYNLQFAPLGIKIVLSKKYFEIAVKERNTYHPDSGVHFLNQIEALFNRHNERKYKNSPNNYNCIVLTVSPQDKSILPKELCKSYSFVTKKKERLHTGKAPVQVFYEDNKVLKKIEKRLYTLSKKAKGKNPEKICKDTIFDAFRYCFSKKYSYKNKILGKDRSYWDFILMIPTTVLAIVTVVVLYYIGIFN